MSKKCSHKSTALCAAAMVCLLLIYPDKAFESVDSSLKRCAAGLLPSIFPMSVLSKQISPYLFFGKNRLCAILTKLSGFSSNELPIFLTSLFCGYPIPSTIAKDMYDSGGLTKNQAKKAIVLCNNASPGYLIFFVGKCVFGSLFFGAVLYISQVLSVIVLAHLFKNQETALPSKKLTSETLSQSIVRSAQSMVTLFGFVIFFSLVGDLLKAVLAETNTPLLIRLFIAGVFESSAGINGISRLAIFTKLPLVCFFCSFGGLSVFFQVKASAGDELTDASEYLAARLAVFAGMLFFMLPVAILAKNSLL